MFICIVRLAAQDRISRSSGTRPKQRVRRYSSKAAGATLRTVAESAASAAASSLTCISVFRTKTLALPSGPLCLRLDRCARVWAAIICVWMAVRVSGPP